MEINGYVNLRSLETKHLTEAGWTETAISRFLSAPVIEERRSSIHGKYNVRLWDAASVLLAAQCEPCRAYFAALKKRRTKVKQHKVIDVLDATREASRSAHRWRDRASEALGARPEDVCRDMQRKQEPLVLPQGAGHRRPAQGRDAEVRWIDAAGYGGV
jgi:hypothetical protein